MIVKELKVPMIQDEDGHIIGYGGNQDWFPDKWARQAGCGSVAASNIAACFSLNCQGFEALAPNAREQMGKEEFLSLMQEMYSRMKPGLMGYPYPAKLGKAFAAYAKEREIDLTPRAVCRWKDWEEGYRLVKDSIDGGTAVGFLILAHRAPELKEDIWHWITICGYEEPEEEGEEPVLIVSDCGDRDRYPASLLLETHRSNVTRMVLLVQQP